MVLALLPSTNEALLNYVRSRGLTNMRISLPIQWRHERDVVFLVIGILASAGQTFAQGQASQIHGRVTDEHGAALQGVQVVAQATYEPWRASHVTSSVGDYVLRALPAGVYVVTFSRDDRVRTRSLLHVPAGTVVMYDVVLTPAVARAEAVVVEGDTRRPLDLTDAGFTIAAGALQRLPRSDSLRSAWSFLPGSVTASEASGHISIDGAALETVPFDQAPVLDLSVSALQEVTTWPAVSPLGTGGISWDRVAVTTRAGSRLFHGVLLAGVGPTGASGDLVWEGDENARALGEFSATLGGPLVTGRTFFHASMRRSAYDALTGHPAFTTLGLVKHNARNWSGRLTHLVGDDHRIEGLWAHGRWDFNTDSGVVPSVWTETGAAARSPRQHLASVSYTGLTGPTRSIELRLTHERWSSNDISDAGSTPPAVEFGDRLSGLTWLPACAGCPERERQITTFRAVGRQRFATQHEIGAVIEVSGASRQSHADALRVLVPFSRRDDVVAVIGRGEPVWWHPSAQSGIDLGTVTLAANDVWRIDRSWTLDVGVRWDRRRFVSSTSASEVWNSFSPSIGVAWTPALRADWSVRASYSRDRRPAAAWLDAPLGGQLFSYTGGPLVIQDNETSAGEAGDALLAWFRSTAEPPLIDLERVLASRSGNAESSDGSTWALGLHRSAGPLTVRADLFLRRSPASVVLGTLAAEGSGEGLAVEELEDAATRSLDLRVDATYRLGLQIEYGASYAFRRPLDEGGVPLTDHLALALAGASLSDALWAAGGGPTNPASRHRLQGWLAARVIEDDKVGVIGVDLIVRYDASARYGARGWVEQELADGRPVRVPYWFTDRDEFGGRSVMRTDMRLSYSRSIGVARADWFARLDMLNIFNQLGQSRPTPDVLAMTAADAPERFSAFDPFAEVPVRGVHWDLAAEPDPKTKFPPTFGRALRLQVGVEF
jgi:hypothetical protein